MSVAPGQPDTPTPAGRRDFLTTQWSVILRARDGGGTRSAEALAALCRDYWLPLYAFARRKGSTPADAQDFVQGFFARLIERDSLANVSREKGRFRSFLMAALQHYIADERDRERSQKRGGARPHLHLDTTDAERLYASELVDGETPERAFDRSWARAVLGRAQRRLRDECAAAGKDGLFAAVGPTSDNAESLADIGARLGLTESAMKSAAFRLRARYRELIRDEIAQTVSSERELDEELRALLAALSL